MAVITAHCDVIALSVPANFVAGIGFLIQTDVWFAKRLRKSGGTAWCAAHGCRRAGEALRVIPRKHGLPGFIGDESTGTLISGAAPPEGRTTNYGTTLAPASGVSPGDERRPI